jgi:hypothetical protein
MRLRLLAVFGLLTAVALTGCGLFDEDEASSAISADLYEGQVTVGLTDNVPASGTYVLQNIYNPNVREILAIVQIENADPGVEVIGRWYQMGVIQQRAENITPEGGLISEAGFEITNESINAESGRGGGRLTLRPNAPLPEDSYEVRVYIDGKLAKIAPFVVSRLVPGPAGSGSQTSPTPQRTATPNP